MKLTLVAQNKTFNLINNDGTMTLIWKDGAMVEMTVTLSQKL